MTKIKNLFLAFSLALALCAPAWSQSGLVNPHFISDAPGAIPRTFADKGRDALNAADIGIIANDNTKRAENTAKLQAALAVGSGKSEVVFRSDCGTIYLESFTFPNKPISIRSSGVMRVNNACILDFSPTGAVAISAPDSSDQGRHSELSGFSIIGPDNKTCIKIDQGGLTLHDLHVSGCDIGMHLTQSHLASYARVTLVAGTIALFFDGTTVAGMPGAVDGNSFEELDLSTPINGIIAGDKGLFIFPSTSGLMVGNHFRTLNVSRNDVGIYVGTGASWQKVFESIWCESTTTRMIQYDLTGTPIQSDHYSELYIGAPGPTFPDIYAPFVSVSTNRNLQTGYASFGPNITQPAAIDAARSKVLQDVDAALVSISQTKVGANQLFWRFDKASATGTAIDLLTVDPTGSDAGSSNVINVRTWDIGINGNYQFSEGIAMSIQTGLANTIPLAMTTLRSSVLGLGTLAWSSPTGSAVLRYTPNASADTSYVEVVVIARKNQEIIPK